MSLGWPTHSFLLLPPRKTTTRTVRCARALQALKLVEACRAGAPHLAHWPTL